MVLFENDNRKEIRVMLDNENFSMVIKLIDSKSFDTIYLGDSEFLIMKKLFENDGKVVKRDELVEVGWPNKVVSQASLNVSIMKLRNKLLEYNSFLKIKTKQSVGYSLHTTKCSYEVIVKKRRLHFRRFKNFRKYSELTYFLVGLGWLVGLVWLSV